MDTTKMQILASRACAVGAALLTPVLGLTPGVTNAMEVDGWHIDMTPTFDQARVELAPAAGDSMISPGVILWKDVIGNASSLSVEMPAPADATRSRRLEASPPVAFSLRHDNGVLLLDTAPHLRGGALVAESSLRRGDDGDPMDMAFELPFRFIESLNDGINGLCADGQAAPSDEGCADLFIADPDDLSEAFSYGGASYVASLSPIGTSFEQLTAGECAAAEASADCVGFQTGEAGVTLVDFTVDIKAVPVPPALLLFPSALIALAAWRRRTTC